MNDADAIAIRPRQDERRPKPRGRVGARAPAWTAIPSKESQIQRHGSDHRARLRHWTAVSDEAPIGHISLTHAGPSDDAAALWQSLTGGEIERLVIPVRLFVDPRTEAVGWADA